MSTLALGHPASYSMGIWSFFLGDKQLGCEAGHLTPSGAEVNEWTSPCMPEGHTEGQLYLMQHVYRFPEFAHLFLGPNEHSRGHKYLK